MNDQNFRADEEARDQCRDRAETRLPIGRGARDDRDSPCKGESVGLGFRYHGKLHAATRIWTSPHPHTVKVISISASP